MFIKSNGISSDLNGTYRAINQQNSIFLSYDN